MSDPNERLDCVDMNLASCEEKLSTARAEVQRLITQYNELRAALSHANLTDFFRTADSAWDTNATWARELQKYLGLTQKPVSGTCCSCGYSGEDETTCPHRSDVLHCEHWYDGPDVDGED
jgi:hypothetical protein